MWLELVFVREDVFKERTLLIEYILLMLMLNRFFVNASSSHPIEVPHHQAQAQSVTAVCSVHLLKHLHRSHH